MVLQLSTQLADEAVALAALSAHGSAHSLQADNTKVSPDKHSKPVAHQQVEPPSRAAAAGDAGAATAQPKSSDLVQLVTQRLTQRLTQQHSAAGPTQLDSKSKSSVHAPAPSPDSTPRLPASEDGAAAPAVSGSAPGGAPANRLLTAPVAAWAASQLQNQRAATVKRSQAPAAAIMHPGKVAPMPADSSSQTIRLETMRLPDSRGQSPRSGSSQPSSTVASSGAKDSSGSVAKAIFSRVALLGMKHAINANQVAPEPAAAAQPAARSGTAADAAAKARPATLAVAWGGLEDANTEAVPPKEHVRPVSPPTTPVEAWDPTASSPRALSNSSEDSSAALSFRDSPGAPGDDSSEEISAAVSLRDMPRAPRANGSAESTAALSLRGMPRAPGANDSDDSSAALSLRDMPRAPRARRASILRFSEPNAPGKLLPH